MLSGSNIVERANVNQRSGPTQRGNVTRRGKAMSKNACEMCGADIKHKKVCPKCDVPIVYRPVVKVKAPLESVVKAQIRAALVETGVCCWVHNVDNRNLSTGLGLGVSDLICIVPPHGRFLAIEVKRPGGKPSDDQLRWLAVVRKFGGVSGVATCVEQALDLLKEARNA